MRGGRTPTRRRRSSQEQLSVLSGVEGGCVVCFCLFVVLWFGKTLAKKQGGLALAKRRTSVWM